jgi:glycosyltransferase involved in cell wall biosynthesis
MTYPGITVVIPSIPSRAVMRNAALASVAAQTLQPAAISIAIDVNREGAPATRDRALRAASTEWVAFLDDDDAFKPEHLEHLYAHAVATGAEFVYSWFEVVGGTDPFPVTHFTNPFDPQNPIETTVTTLVRTDLAKDIGFKSLDRGEMNTGEDYRFTLEAVRLGANIQHLVEKTWWWRHHGDGKARGNTSGLPTKGDSLRW